VNERDRRAIVDSLTQEPGEKRARILASTDSFDTWLSALCPAARRRVGDRVEQVRNWLRMAFS
jgi:hypothetical protein